MTYDLSHLTQNESQNVLGPIQDDEALFLYSIIRGMRLKTIFEIGGLDGYSATNFLRAVGPDGTVFTCDVNPVNKISPNHIVIHKNAFDLNGTDLQNKKIDLIFFDCHDTVQMLVYQTLYNLELIDNNTVIALHDTNTHPKKITSNSYETEDGWVHQTAERKMVNDFVDMGYSPFSLHTKMDIHDDSFPFRHGVTILTRWKKLKN